MRSVFFPHLVNGPFGDPALYVRLAHQGEAFLFDCGDLHPLSPRELLKIKAVFISHAHIDHLVGFDTLLRSFLYRPGPLFFYGPPGLIDRIGHKLAGYTWNLIEGYPLTLIVREWGEPRGREAVFRAGEGFRHGEVTPFDCPQGGLLETKDLRVRAVPLDHGGILSLGYTLEETLHVAIHREVLDARGFAPGKWLTTFKGDVRRGASPETPVTVPLTAGGETVVPLRELTGKISHQEKGMKLVYVTDVSPSLENERKIVELAAGAHLLAIEATFAGADLERARSRNHLTAPLAGTLARRAGAGRLLVFHHSPRYQDEPGQLEAEALRAFRGEEHQGNCA